jgi:hypothetical protein
MLGPIPVERGYGVVEIVYPDDGAIFYREGELFLVPGWTEEHRVTLEGLIETDYSALWIMNLSIDDQVLDHDNGFGPIRTDNAGLWTRRAKGSGRLYGEAFLGVGQHRVTGFADLTASRPGGIVGRTPQEQSHTFTILNP